MSERSVWVAGVVDVEVVVRREVVWPVSVVVSVVVAVDMGTWDLLGDVDGKDPPRRRGAAGWRKSANEWEAPIASYRFWGAGWRVRLPTGGRAVRTRIGRNQCEASIWVSGGALGEPRSFRPPVSSRHRPHFPGRVRRRMTLLP